MPAHKRPATTPTATFASPSAVAKIFQNGASQAVRLPKEFRFADDEVCIKRIGSAVMLYPKTGAWQIMSDAVGKADADFMSKRNEPKRAERRRRL